MPTPEETIRLYAQLAEEHQKRDRPQERDRFLLLAADAALSAGKRDVAENFRRTLLNRNPNHLLKPYASLGEALESPDIANYVQELRRTYPPERVQRGAKVGGTALSGKNGEEEEFILPLDFERTKVKPNFAFQLDPDPVVRPGGKAMANPNDPYPMARPAAPPANLPPQPLPASSGPGVFALKREAPAPRRAASPATPRAPVEVQSGGWIGAFLFFITLMAGLALFGWVFVRPFVALP